MSRRTRFEISPEVGTVSALLDAPAESPRALLVLAHGAGAGMEHTTMAAIAASLAVRGLAVLRFNFPFREFGRPRVDARDVATLAIAQAASHARELVPDVPLVLGGHSFGGRMASHAVLEHDIPGVQCLVFCAFPLHNAGKPSRTRAEHLSQIALPMIFLSGTRDALAQPELLVATVDELGTHATLHWLDTADHSYKVLKRSRKSTTPIFDEMAQTIVEFVDLAKKGS